MNILIDPDESFAPHLETWSCGFIPMPWLERYAEPIVILAGGLSRRFVRKEIDRSLVTLADGIRDAIQERFDIAPPPLPEIRIKVVQGDLSDWRSGAGHFLAARCNGCFEVFPTYWTETSEDRDLALAMERVHPVIPFLDRQVSVFKGLDFAGCFCGLCDCRSFHRDALSELRYFSAEMNHDDQKIRKTA